MFFPARNEPCDESQGSFIILGLGNILCGDEGFGVHALHRLHSRSPFEAPVRWIDGGVAGLDLLPMIESCSHLLVLDAVDAGLAPGSLCELYGTDLLRGSGQNLSEHQVSFQDVLGLAYIRGFFPEKLCLLGIQPASLAPDAKLSSIVENALERVVSRAQAVIAEWTVSEME